MAKIRFFNDQQISDGKSWWLKSKSSYKLWECDFKTYDLLSLLQKIAPLHNSNCRKKNNFQTLNKLKREMTFMSDWSPEQYIWIDVTTLCSSETSNFFIIRSIYKAGNSSFIATITTAFVVQLFKSGFSSNFVHKSCLLVQGIDTTLVLSLSPILTKFIQSKDSSHSL